MRLITERDEIRTVAARWQAQYSAPHWHTPREKDKQEIAAKLRALDLETATREEVAEIIGNDGWIRMTCDECDLEQKVVVHIGAEPDYDARWQQLCGYCLSRAVALLKGAA